MNGTLFPARVALALVIIISLLLLATGFIYYSQKQAGCQYGKRFITEEWTTVFSIANVEFRLHPYGCPTAEQYDKSLFQRTNGAIPRGVLPSSN